MGSDIAGTAYTREERQRYREKVRQDLDVFERMLHTRGFEFERQLTGMEIEMNLVDADMQPTMNNAAVLESIHDSDYQTELGQYNIELNVSPRPMPGDEALKLEKDLRASLNRADDLAQQAGARIVTVGILPTIMPEHFHTEWMSANTRYAALNEAIFNARGEDLFIDIEGPTGERLATFADTIAPESACTSVQLHLQVQPLQFAAYWNAAQALSSLQLALGANSPYFFGKQLWHETRIPLFKQATDTRSVELKNQGVRPRVWFGERWITSIFDLFEENVRYFPALLPECSDEDPVAVFEAGDAPALSELRLHNGTVYRWNRPIYDIVDGKPHLRVENRVLPAGPTIVDTIANSAFYYGVVRMLAEDERPVWTRMSFSAADENFTQCARRSLDAKVYWPGFGEVASDELILRHLLPLAHEGLAKWGVAQSVRDRFLGVVEDRCRAGVNGATWQIACVNALEAKGMTRADALVGMMERYLVGMNDNAPVHTWELPS
ncbi:glutamate--cysteine ligase [Yimella sp. cx-51]|uniref:glutamate--cysteine ligase n=1 Tax=Yimella sp. cx-51 TaxID=2770551 RepID=UPI00165DCC52|nr:glutamate--cysteine ligase [Yimella sp. cx-51]MBC9957786.1 glutamate--cysteine ligase [Yimella sp. cx-51]MBD2758802.1 glutamate--cysteine ligase [Yimella sp. cx-573]QTH36871.1 glutamate--cysteine ligase [Yimella sp. cx-51]